jgi:hypothetical protein
MMIPFRALGRDLFAEIQCDCPDPQWADSTVAHLFKTKLKLTGYYDAYFFAQVNAQPRTVACPNCKREFVYRWTPEGVVLE